MPKSTAVSRAGAATNRLPSCRSAWNTPWSRAWARKRAHQVVGEAPGGRARLRPARPVGQRRAARPLQGQHPPRDALPAPPPAPACSRRAAMTSRSSSAPAASKRRSSSSSSARVTVDQRRPAARGGGRPGPGARPGAAARRSAATSRATRRSMPGPQHLDRHLAAVGEPRPVGLRQGCGGDRARRTPRKRLRTAARAPRPTSAPATSIGKGGKLVLQTPKVVGEGGAEDIGAGGEELAELDRHRPQALQRRRQPLARPSPTRLWTGEEPQEPRQRSNVEAAGARSISRGIRASARISIQHRAGKPSADASSATSVRSPSPGAGRRRRR